jgi:mono/diheme cytochrome c family protein
MRLRILLLGCGLALASPAAPPRFESDIAPLLKARCGACHSAAARQGGLSIESRDDLVKGGKTGAAVIPGNGVDGLLLAMISSGRMPMGGNKLPQNEIERIRSWIEGGALLDGETDKQVTTSEKEVLTVILGAKCFVCHGRRRQEAGLDLQTRESLLRGGKSGPAIVPGKPDESLIVRRIAAQQMPPPKLQERFSVRGLTSDEFEKLKQWIAAGAPSDTDSTAEKPPAFRKEDQQFWAFRPPARPLVPATAPHPIDAFLLDRLKAKNLSFSPQADRSTLIRRLYLDLLGFPPTAAGVRAFVDDPDPRAYENLVDRLLASPHYGERWARYWLDAAGYADSEGGVSNDTIRPFAWRYRDYVIRSLNADKPYDRFLTEQIAGDELFDYKAADEYTPEQIDLLVATGFLRQAPDPTYSTEQNFIPERLNTIATEIEILGSAVMGLTVGCARCHDHKYDPIPTRDYYQLSAIFRPAYDPWDWRVPNQGCVGVGAQCTDDDVRILPLKSAGERKAVEDFNRPVQGSITTLQAQLERLTAPWKDSIRQTRMAALPEAVRGDLQQALDTPENSRTEVHKYLILKFEDTVKVTLEDVRRAFPEHRDEIDALNKQIAAEKKKLKPAPHIRAMFDMGGEPTPVRVLLRGEFTNPGELVSPGVPSILSGLQPYRVEPPRFSTRTSGRRLAFARWLTQPEHPLTARVLVNRIWQGHFGEGLVRSPANFGRTGMPPTHPELLDWLATEFVRQKWSIKAIHRVILTSTAYRQSSKATESALTADPGNELLSRFPLRRLDSDALHDSVLAVAGRLDTTPFGPAVPIVQRPDGEVIAKTDTVGERRSIYLLQRRSLPMTMMNVFDAPLLSPNCIKRGQSTVASQALNLINSDLVRTSAQYLAGRIIDSAGSDVPARINQLFLSVYGRMPSDSEKERVAATLNELTGAWKAGLERTRPPEPVAQTADWKALATVCHTLLNSAEFLYVD